MKTLIAVLMLCAFSAQCQFVHNAQLRMVELPLAEPLTFLGESTIAQLSLFIPEQAPLISDAYQASQFFREPQYTLQKNQPALVSGFAWRHLYENSQLESAFTPDINLAYKLSAAGNDTSYYNFGIALIRPSQQSMAWNAANAASADTDRVTSFLTLSFHSRF